MNVDLFCFMYVSFFYKHLQKYESISNKRMCFNIFIEQTYRIQTIEMIKYLQHYGMTI